jgi:Major Facilitator Superfamily
MTRKAEATLRSAKRPLRDRTLAHYPPPRTRMTCLGIVVLATVVLYYQFFLIGAVSTRVMAEFHLSFTAYGVITVGAAVAGAVASLLAGIADRYGRANIITIGLAIVGLLCLAGVPHVHSKASFAILWLAIGFVEGVILVATPAMIRDFSPQVGRASAMGFWTLGPVLGSLAVSLQVSRASNGMPWQDHFMIAGVAGLGRDRDRRRLPHQPGPGRSPAVSPGQFARRRPGVHGRPRAPGAGRSRAADRAGPGPAADRALLATYGPPLQDPKVQAALKTLQQQGPAVKKAAAGAPGHWQHYFWIAVGGQARRRALDHEAKTAAELAALTTSPQPARTGA